MKISICLPTLNQRPEMMLKLLASLERQSHTDWEIRVNMERIGIFPALNKSMADSDGDIFCFACDDDEFAVPDGLAIAASRFGEHTHEPYWIYGRCELINESGDVRAVVGEKANYGDMLEGNKLCQPAVFWNRKMYEEAGGFDPQYEHAADYDMWLRMWEISPPEFVPHVIARYRTWGKAHSNRNGRSVAKEKALIAERHASVSI